MAVVLAGDVKAADRSAVSGTYGDEEAFLRKLFLRFLPSHVRKAVLGPTLTEVKQIVAILVFTGAVGVGYLYGLFTVRTPRADAEEAAESERP